MTLNYLKGQLNSPALKQTLYNTMESIFPTNQWSPSQPEKENNVNLLSKIVKK